MGPGTKVKTNTTLFFTCDGRCFTKAVKNTNHMVAAGVPGVIKQNWTNAMSSVDLHEEVGLVQCPKEFFIPKRFLDVVDA